MADVGVLKAILSLDTRQFARGLRRASSQLATAGQRMETLGRKMTLAVSAPLIGVGVVATKFAVDFDDSLSKIVGLVGVAGDQVQEWRDQILQLGPAVGKGPQELADAMFFITSAGLRGAAALETLEATAKASAAGLGSTEIVADAVTSAINAYGAANLSAADATGILVAAVREGKASAESIAPVLGRVIPLAAELGVSFDQVAASIAAMTRLGANAEQAATALRATLAGILKPAAESAEALASVGLSAEGLRQQLREKGLMDVLFSLKEAFDGNSAAMAKVFPNIRALTGVLNLVGQNADAARLIFESLATAGEEDLNRSFEVAAATAKFQLAQALSVLRVAAIRLGDVLLPIVVPAVKRLGEVAGELADKFRALSPKMKSVILILAGLAIGGPPVLIVLGLMATGIAAIGTAMALTASIVTGAMGLVATAIAAASVPVLVAVGVVAGLTAAWLLFREEISAVAARVVEVLAPVVSAILRVAKTAAVIVIAFNPVTLAVGTAMALWAEFGDTISRVASSMVGTLKSWALAFVGWGRSIGEVVVETVRALREWLVDKFNTIVVEPVKKLIDSVLGFFQDLFQRILDIAGRFVPGFAEKFDEIKAAIAEKIGAGVEIAKVHLSRVEGAFGDIGDRAEVAFGRVQIVVSDTGKVIKEKLVGAINSAKDAIVDLIPVADAAAFSLENLGKTGAAAVGGVTPAVEDLTTKVADLSDLAEDVNSTFESSFTNLIVNARKGEEAIADFIRSVVQGIQRIIAQRIAQQIVEKTIGKLFKSEIEKRKELLEIEKQITAQRVIQAGVAAGSGGGGGGGGGGGFFASLGKIFGFAEGAIVTRPTLALIGEKGPEAVVPLSRIGPAAPAVKVEVINPPTQPTIRQRRDGNAQVIQVIFDQIEGRIAQSVQSGRVGQSIETEFDAQRRAVRR